MSQEVLWIPEASWKTWASTNTTVASSCCMNNQGEQPVFHRRAISKREGAGPSFLRRIPSPRMVYLSYRQPTDQFTCTVFLDRDNSFQDFRFLILFQLKENVLTPAPLLWSLRWSKKSIHILIEESYFGGRDTKPVN